MRTKIRYSLAVSTMLVLLTGCGGGEAADDRPDASPSAGGGLGDIVVEGKAITGSKPSGNKKIPYQRTYTEAELYAAVTGYRSLAFGTSQLEAIYQPDLFEGSGDVETTIDPEAQKAAFTALGSREGAAVAVDAASGDLLAVVSTPSYDPGSFSGNLPKDAEVWRQLAKDERQPLLNRALREATDPGGTFGVVIAAAALEHGLYTSVDETLGSADDGACATLREALTESCDTVLAAVADELGPAKVGATAQKLGFGDNDLRVPVRVTESTYGNGRATATTLEMARVAAALADEGWLVPPRMVREAEEPKTRALSARTAESLLPVLRATPRWSPAETLDGTPVSWSLAHAVTADGRTVAIATWVESADATLAARVGDRIAEAVS